MLSDYDRLIDLMGTPGASEKTAKLIVKYSKQ